MGEWDGGTSRRSGSAKRRRTAALLDAVGLSAVAHRPAGRLSGGEQQRLAVAVALAHGPRLLLADAPTNQPDHPSPPAGPPPIPAPHPAPRPTILLVRHPPAPPPAT